MHSLSTAFVLDYHGCSNAVAEQLLAGAKFLPSENTYDWLGTGVYFWESNPRRGLEFYMETQRRKQVSSDNPAVVGAVIDLGYLPRPFVVARDRRRCHISFKAEEGFQSVRQHPAAQ